MIPKSYFTYILTNKYDHVLYVGVTNDLKRRVKEHRSSHKGSFTNRYNVHKLVYYEISTNPSFAIKREKQIKNLIRRKKIELINKFNPDWEDLYKKIRNN